MNFKETVNQLGIDLDFCAVSPSGGTFHLKAMDIAPMEFLVLAEEDFVKGGIASSVNSITNAKRAIVSQMDQILISFGYKSLPWNIPQKIKMLKDLGVLLPPILRKISKTRNLLEHEYKKPGKEDVESALDIASLYVWGMSSLFNGLCDEIQFGFDKCYDNQRDEYKKYIDFGITSEKEEVFYRGYAYEFKEVDGKEQRMTHEIKIKNSEPIFFAIVRIAIAFNTGYKIDESIKIFDQVFKNT